MSIEDIIMKEEMFEEKPLDFPFGETEKRLADLGISMPSFRTFEPSTPGTVDIRGLDFTHYYQWLQTARSWINDSSDFMLSYSFVEGHPALWTRSRPDQRPHDWNTSSGVSGLWSSPTWRSNGSVVMMMEAGAAVPPHRQYTCHDTRLDTYEDTYEKGIITTANRIHKFFDLDGSERPNVHYEKSNLEVELEECMAAIAKGHSGSKLDNDE